MERERLTGRIVQNAKVIGGVGESILWDAGADGLGLRVRASGRKTWVLDYSTRDGRRRRITLGKPPAWSVERARREATERLAAIMGGGDPMEERHDAKRAVTFEDLGQRFLERHSKRRKRTWPEDVRVLKRELLPLWAKRKAESIGRRDVAALHSDLGTRGEYQANRILALVSAIYAWGERVGELPENHPNPARKIARFKEKSRDRWLSPGEVRKVMQAVEAEKNIYVKGYFWLALLLGTRKSELLSLRWADVDVQQATLKLPETKSGRPHTLTLSPRALDVLRGLPRERGNPFVFVGRFEGEALSVPCIDQAWRRVRAAAGAPDARMHDLRRTLGSWMAQSGATLHLIGRVLNHSTPQTTMVYSHFSNESMRAALDAHGERVMQAVGVLPALVRDA